MCLSQFWPLWTIRENGNSTIRSKNDRSHSHAHHKETGTSNDVTICRSMSLFCLQKYNKVIWSAKNGSAMESAYDSASFATLSLSNCLFLIYLGSYYCTCTFLRGSQLEIVPKPKQASITKQQRERKVEKASVNWIQLAKCKLPKSVYNVAPRVIKPCSAAALKEWRKKKIRIRWWCMDACQVLPCVTCYQIHGESKHLTQLKEEACWWPIF